MFPSFPLLIKPAGAACNMRCRYCFYLEKQKLHPEKSGVMGRDVLEKMCRSYLSQPLSRHLFIWQGGEPLVAGLDFFREAVGLQKRYAPCGTVGATVENFVQTNGTLITRDWARFFREEDFLVGVSLDGPEELHDTYRTDSSGRGSYGRVLRGLALLKEAGCRVNILTVVTGSSARHAKNIFTLLCDMGFEHQQYIPCVEFDRAGQPLPWTVGSDAWGGFLIDLGDAWSGRAYLDISIRYFDSLLSRLLFGTPRLCHMGSDCRQYLVVERTGDIYPCDFFVDRHFLLGRAGQTPWRQMLESPAFRHFGANKRKRARTCRTCTYQTLCGGDCLKHRMREGRFVPNQQSWLCEGYKAFLAHALPGFEAAAQHLQTHGTPVPGHVFRQLQH
jgi:uncharacterized protein